MKLYATWKVKGSRDWADELVRALNDLGIKRDWSFPSIMERVITGFGFVGDNFARYTLPLRGNGVSVNIQNSSIYQDARTKLNLGFIPIPMSFDYCELGSAAEIALMAESPRLAVPSYNEIAKYACKNKVLEHHVAGKLSEILL